ncbi:MAG: hypothetical protein LBM78_00290, partial [Clostridiales bacterium]|nr:hypothetical protein [Clostridiales bacterium]
GGAGTGTAADTPPAASAISDYCKEKEDKLAATLHNIYGAGQVKVMIHFESTPELIVAYLTTNSTSGGGTQTSQTPQILNNAGNQLPYILKQINPKVLGVIVACEGARDPRVRIEIMNAVGTLFGIEQRLIYVFPIK